MFSVREVSDLTTTLSGQTDVHWAVGSQVAHGSTTKDKLNEQQKSTARTHTRTQIHYRQVMAIDNVTVNTLSPVITKHSKSHARTHTCITGR